MSLREFTRVLTSFCRGSGQSGQNGVYLYSGEGVVGTSPYEAGALSARAGPPGCAGEARGRAWTEGHASPLSGLPYQPGLTYASIQLRRNTHSLVFIGSIKAGKSA